MKILAVDDEKIALDGLIKSIKGVASTAFINGFRYPDEALEYALNNAIDVAFLDIEMPGMSGVELAKKLLKINPKINVIFSTGYGQYRDVAFDMYASGYLVKPITVEKVKKALENLRHGVEINNVIDIVTFGNFEVYYKGKPLEFKYRKSKEMLAYLVDRKGALCSVNEIIAILFEDDDGHDAYFKSIRRDLLDTILKTGCQEVIVVQRGLMGIDKDKVKCDYYEYLKGNLSLKDSYYGEYMSQYAWGESTNAELERKSR